MVYHWQETTKVKKKKISKWESTTALGVWGFKSLYVISRSQSRFQGWWYAGLPAILVKYPRICCKYEKYILWE